MVGHNFKSDIYFYELPENTNRKISQKVYNNKIFQPIVKLWIETNYDFILKEDGGLNHRLGK